MPIFKRNLTSILLEKAARKVLARINNELNVLELGCGDGNIIRSLARDFEHNNYYASDISEESIIQARSLSNCASGCDVRFEVGAGFDSWQHQKFDLIVCDISAINQEIANLSDWYSGISCEAGDDGLKAVRSIIQNSKTYLAGDGVFILPAISLSNVDELEKMLRLHFSKLLLSERKDWPMPKELVDKIKYKNITGKGINWNFKSKFGIEIANTAVYQCEV